MTPGTWSKGTRPTYSAPATAEGGSTGASSAPPHGARFRLRADHPLELLRNEGGIITFTARSDWFTTAKWSGLLGSLDLNDIAISDFEMIEASERLENPNFQEVCVRAAPEPSVTMTGITAYAALAIARRARASSLPVAAR